MIGGKTRTIDLEIPDIVSTSLRSKMTLDSGNY